MDVFTLFLKNKKEGGNRNMKSPGPWDGDDIDLGENNPPPEVEFSWEKKQETKDSE
ncbi:MAG: hypothetical protein UR78_C0017G0012 [Candidatus Moranbacteria bacterium GW2011_GWF2_35_39]|nr:MAG: hypothetical protein UR78_C0017G0012 [Candidatus Moranbacteria bacterium GW2011_GWF2_35_39]